MVGGHLNTELRPEATTAAFDLLANGRRLWNVFVGGPKEMNRTRRRLRTLTLSLVLTALGSGLCAADEPTSSPPTESYRLQGVELYVVGQILAEKAHRPVRVAPRIMMEKVTISTEKIPESEVLAAFTKQLQAAGYQVDDSGEVIGILRPAKAD